LSGNVWVAQAASLFFSAACRKALEKPSHRKFLNGFDARRRQADERLQVALPENSVASRRKKSVYLPSVVQI
jgi:hypothetical protein